MSVNFKSTMDNSDFRKKLEEMRKDLSKTSDVAEQEGRNIEATFKKLGVAVGGFFAANQMLGYVKQIATVRGEFQQLEAAYRTMLGSKAKADQLMQQTINFAATTPFDLQGVAAGTKQLLAYGSEAEKVSEELTMLGNIAAGLSIPLNDIIYLYGTTRAQGRMFTQDLRQFMGRGIPLAEELAKQFGVTSAEVGQLVTDGKVGFEEMRKALAAMTAEGGKFSGLMDAQSKTISGQISNLEDAIQQMFNDMGKASEGVISGALSAVSSIVENYQEIGRVLLEIVATVGAYKAAMIALTVVEKARVKILEETVIQEKLAAMSGLTLSKSQAIAAGTSATLTRSLKGAAAAAKAFVTSTGGMVAIATALGYGIYKLITYQTEYQKGLKELNKSFEEGRSEANAQITTLAQLKGKLAALKEGTEEYSNTQKKIAAIAKEYGVQLKAEEVTVISLTEKYNSLTAAITSSYNARQYDMYSGTAQKNWADTLSQELDSKLYAKYVKTFGDEIGTEYYQAIKNRIFDAVANDTDLTGLKALTDALTEGDVANVRSAGAETEFRKILDAYVNYARLMKEAKKKFQPEQKEDDGTSVDGDTSVPTSYMMDYRKAEKKWKESKSRLTEIEKDKRHFTSAQYKAAAEAEKAAREAFEAAGGNPSGEEKRAKDAAKAKEEANKEALKKEKEYQEALLELARQATEEQKSVEIEGMDDSLEIITRRAELARARIEAERADFKRRYGNDKDTSSFDARIAVVGVSERQQKQQYIDSLLDTYQTVEQKRMAIIEKYQKDINALRASGEESAAVEAEKALRGALTNFEMQTGKAMKGIFRDVSKQTKKELLDNLKKANDIVTTLTDPEQIAKFQEQIARISDELANIEPIDFNANWASVASSMNELLKKKRTLAGINDKESETYKELSSQVERTKQDIGSQLAGAGINTFVSGLQTAADLMAQIAELSGDVDLADKAEILGSLASNLSAAGQGAASGEWIGAIVGGVSNMIEQTINAFAESKASVIAYEKALEDFRQTISLMKYEIDSDDYDSIFGTNSLEKARDAGKKAREAMEEYMSELGRAMEVTAEYRKSWSWGAALLGGDLIGTIGQWITGNQGGNQTGSPTDTLSQLLENSRKDMNQWEQQMNALERGLTALEGISVRVDRKSGWQKFWGGQDEYKSLKDVAPELWDKETGEFLTENARALLETDIDISDEQRRQIENAIELKEAYDEAQKVIEDVAQSYFGNVSSDWAKSIWDNYIKYGENAISYVSEDMTDSLSDVASQFGQDLLAELLNTMLTERYMEQMKKIITGESTKGMPEMISEMLQDMKVWTENGLAFTEEYQKAMEAAGLKINTEDSAQGTSGGFATMSQQSADELSGRFADIQMKATSMAAGIDTIGNIMEEMRGLAMLNNDYLRQIAESSALIKAVNTTMTSIRKKMEDL